MTWICSRCRTRFEERRTRCPHDGRRVVQDLAGEVVGGRYTLRELLGVGGMDSSVWLAWQQSIQRAVAIKLLPPADDPSTERFARGARIASNLSHPNITVVHDYGTTDDGHLYLVMELLDGDTLHKALHQTHLPPARTIHIIDQVLRALDHAHRKNIVHRDIKPGNLYLTQHGDTPDFVKVLDFGIARYIDNSEDPVDKSEITMERQICGTPQYMAPEQVAFGQVDARTDIYALGVVLYRMLTGRLPFQSASHHELFRMHLHSAPPPFKETKPDLDAPPALEAVVMRALAKSPDERFASAAEMRMALRQVRNQMGLPAEPDEPSMPSSTHGWSMETSRPAPTRRGNGWLYAALVVLAAAVIALALMRPPPQPQPQPQPLPEPGMAAAGQQNPNVGQPPPPPAVEPDAAPPAPDAAPPAPDAGAVDAAAVAEADAAPSEDGPVYHKVSVYSRPKGAEVFWGRKSIGRTPLHTRLTNGSHTLTLKLAGYADTAWNLTPSGDSVRVYARTFVLEAQPQPEPAPPPEPPPEPEPQPEPEPAPKVKPKATEIILDEVPDPGRKSGTGGSRVPILGTGGGDEGASGGPGGTRVKTLN